MNWEQCRRFEMTVPPGRSIWEASTPDVWANAHIRRLVYVGYHAPSEGSHGLPYRTGMSSVFEFDEPRTLTIHENMRADPASGQYRFEAELDLPTGIAVFAADDTTTLMWMIRSEVAWWAYQRDHHYPTPPGVSEHTLVEYETAEITEVLGERQERTD